MKIQCNACEAAEATVLCCADEAALCRACDDKVHAANKLAGKHQRIPLLSAGAGGTSSSRVPKCDICQEVSGYFFCLEDRALLCRKCDVAVHTANPYVATHQRFLLTGVQVGLEPTEPVVQVSNEQFNAAGEVRGSPSKPYSRSTPAMSLSTQTNMIIPNQGKDGALVANEASLSGFTMADGIVDWPLDEFFGFPDFSQNFGFTEHSSSKADWGKLGSSEGSPFNCSADEELDTGERLGQVPEFSWKVPEISSPPTASGLYCQRSRRDLSSELCAFVPDIGSSPGSRNLFAKPRGSKRRRHC